MLPKYKQAYPNYNRFLPHLAKHLKDSDFVVDIGANVGDTLAAMYRANDSLRFICTELNDVFYTYQKI